MRFEPPFDKEQGQSEPTGGASPAQKVARAWASGGGPSGWERPKVRLGGQKPPEEDEDDTERGLAMKNGRRTPGIGRSGTQPTHWCLAVFIEQTRTSSPGRNSSMSSLDQPQPISPARLVASNTHAPPTHSSPHPHHRHTLPSSCLPRISRLFSAESSALGASRSLARSS